MERLDRGSRERSRQRKKMRRDWEQAGNRNGEEDIVEKNRDRRTHGGEIKGVRWEIKGDGKEEMEGGW